MQENKTDCIESLYLLKDIVLEACRVKQVILKVH